MKMINFRIFLLASIILLNSLNCTKTSLFAFLGAQQPAEAKPVDRVKAYELQPLSRALFDADPTRKVRRNDFISQIKYSIYNVSRGQIDQIFSFADRNNDDLIDHDEWQSFIKVFIAPFEACDKSKDYLLNADEWKECWKNESKSKFVSFRDIYAENKEQLILNIVSSKNDERLNIADYLLIRRALFSWQECQTAAAYISPTDFKCAIKIAIPDKFFAKFESESLYSSCVDLTGDKTMFELDFISYLRCVYHTYIYYSFTLPNTVSSLEKSEFVKAVKEDRYPLFFTLEDVDLVYKLTDNNAYQRNALMNFQTFSFFFNAHRLFNRFSKNKLQLAKDDLVKMVADPLFPRSIVLAIDAARSGFTAEEYLSVSMVLQRLKPNERDFYYKFKQAEAGAADSGSKSREIFFTTGLGTDKQFWNKEIMLRMLQISNMFIHLTNDKRYIVPVSKLLDEMNTKYDKVFPTFNRSQRSNYVIYKDIPKDFSLDLLTFVDIEVYQWKIGAQTSDNKEPITESNVKSILKDYGMENLPDSVLDIGQKGFDQLRRRVYDARIVIKQIISVQAAIAEKVRTDKEITENKLKPNEDPGRKFPDWSRRFEISPLV